MTKNNSDSPVVIVVRAEQKFSSQILIENKELKGEGIENATTIDMILNDSEVERTILIDASEQGNHEDRDMGADEANNEDIPSFSEWAQKRLEEAEKKKSLCDIYPMQKNKKGGLFKFVENMISFHSTTKCITSNIDIDRSQRRCIIEFNNSVESFNFI